MANGEGNRPRPDPYAQARLAAIIESSHDAIISKDLNSIITSWNPAATDLFGYSEDEAVGKSVLILIPDHLHAEEAEIISRVRNGQRVQSYETIRQRKDGSLVAVSLTVSPVRNRRGRIVGASKIARDISASKESERRIRLLLREVNHRVKNQFAVILSMIRETVKRSEDPRSVEEKIRERIMALSRSHDLLVTSEWSGAGLAELIREHLTPFAHEDRITLSGPELMLKPNAVQHIGMALHELATNSSKYGALADDGRVLVEWHADNDQLTLHWLENSRHRTEPAEPGTRRGFGTVVLLRVTPQALGGSSTLSHEQGRVQWTLTVPLANAIHDNTPAMGDSL